MGSYPIFPFLRRRLVLNAQQAQQHQHVIGLSGSGKSRYLANLFLQLFDAGYGVSLIDPHGDLGKLIVRTLLARGYFTGDAALRKLVYLDIPSAANNNLYLPFNLLTKPALSKAHYSEYDLARNVTDACLRAWRSLEGGIAPTFENMMVLSSQALIENRLPITRLWDFLLVPSFRRALVAKSANRNIKTYFQWFESLRSGDQANAIQSSINRISLLTNDPILGHALGQEQNYLDFRAFMDQGISVIYNLESLRESTQKLLGCLLTVGYEAAAKTRADIINDDDRRVHFLLIDEFPIFSESSEKAFLSILSECRKYKLYLVLAHQTWGQLPLRLQTTIQNAGIDVVFRGGRYDSENAAPILAQIDPHRVGTSKDGKQESTGIQEQFEAVIQELMQLRNRSAYIRMERRLLPFPFNKIWHFGHNGVWKIKTRDVHTPYADDVALAEIMAEYRRYFRSPVIDAGLPSFPVKTGPALLGRKIRL